MPQNYDQTVMYKLTCNDMRIKREFYGSTTDFTSKMANLKQDCTDPHSHRYNDRMFNYIRSTGHWENWSMQEIDEYPCESIQPVKTRIWSHIVQMESKPQKKERYWKELFHLHLAKNVMPIYVKPDEVMLFESEDGTKRIKVYKLNNSSCFYTAVSFKVVLQDICDDNTRNEKVCFNIIWDEMKTLLRIIENMAMKVLKGTAYKEYVFHMESIMFDIVFETKSSVKWISTPTGRMYEMLESW